MASADLTQVLVCPVCQTIYIDPVFLRCGHNFCRICIDHALDIQKESGGYFCPECIEGYTERPALQSNIALKKIAESFPSTQEEARGHCTFCTLSAVMSCLHCDASLCDNHLRVHSTAPDHVFCDPNTSLENMICSDHNELLKYYCTVDAACICVSCSVIGAHVGHKMISLKDASEEKKQKLRNILQKLKTQKDEVDKSVQSQKNYRSKVQEKAEGEEERVKALFEDYKKQLNVLQERVLSDINRQVQRVSQSYDDNIQQLETKEEELSRKMRRIEELCNVTDPLTVLQESDTGDLCDMEDRERHDKQLHDGGDLDVAGISHTLHTGLSDILSGVIVRKHADTQDYPQCKKEDKVPIIAKLFRPRPKLAPTAKNAQRQAGGTNNGAVQQTSGLPVYADILLDVNTASNYLHISADRKTASKSDSSQSHPETPERFKRDPQVLSSRSFSSGRHYWEVDVGRSDWWRVGMCYSSIDRRGEKSGIGDNKKSWGLERGYNQYSVRHDRKVTQLPDKSPSDRVRICLDYEAGQISFYALCDPIRLLHTFTAAFTEPLHAGFGVWKGSIKISERESGEVRGTGNTTHL